MALEVTVKKWGNSLGIVIPSETADKLGIKPEEIISIEIHKEKNALKDLFGTLPFKKPTRQILKEAREELESTWMP